MSFMSLVSSIVCLLCFMLLWMFLIIVWLWYILYVSVLLMTQQILYWKLIYYIYFSSELIICVWLVQFTIFFWALILFYLGIFLALIPILFSLPCFCLHAHCEGEVISLSNDWQKGGESVLILLYKFVEKKVLIHKLIKKVYWIIV